MAMALHSVGYFDLFPQIDRHLASGVAKYHFSIVQDSQNMKMTVSFEPFDTF